MRPLAVRWLGRVPYEEGLRLQEALRDRVARGEAPDTLLLLEHDPVITLGRAARPEHILADEATLAQLGIRRFPVRRGGGVTYHGPGQLVGYPILDLTRHGKDLLRYVRTLEQSLIALLAEYGVAARAVPGRTGVWVGGAKVAAIGVHVSRWVTAHGFALNVDPDLSHFATIIPCGLHDAAVTSLARLLGKAPAVDAVAARFVPVFARAFGYAEPALLREAAS